MLTGVYESLERDEAADIIKQYGGKVTTSLSRKTSYIVMGEDAGLAKVAKADELGTKRLSEDGLLDLIRVKSGLPTKSEDTPSKDKKSPVKMEAKENTTDGQSKTKMKDSPKKIKEERTTPKKEDRRTPKKDERKIPKKDEPTPQTSSSVKSINFKQEKSEDIPFDRKPTEHQQNIDSIDNKAWVEKYKPTTIKQIIGQQGAASNVVK